MEPLEPLFEPAGDVSAYPYVADPVRQRASLAVNTRAGRPVVDIRCAISYRKGRCGRPLGGVWITDYGTIVLVNRLTEGLVRPYMDLSQRPEARNREWHERGWVLDLPVILRVRGEWRPVPGSPGDTEVRCPRRGHGHWPLDVQDVVELTEMALSTKERQTYWTAP